MSYGGPPTLAQKRMMALRGESTTNAPHSAPATAGPHNLPLLPALYDQSSSASTSPNSVTDNQPAFDDIEMRDISAPASTTGSPPASYTQPSFSAAAKPFVPPGATSAAAVTTPSASTTPMKRLPPHRAMQAQPSKNSAAIPIVKPKPPAAPALTAQNAVEPSAASALTQKSAIELSARRAGPHAKLGPHARKVDTPVQSDAPSSVTAQAHAPTTAQDDKISPQQTPGPDTWAGVQEPEVVQKESSSVQETQVKAGAAAPISEESTALDSAQNRITRHIGPNKWLTMLDDLKEPEKGRELILALADHLRASVESRELNNSKEMAVLMENASGQRMPARVDPDMTISDMIKQCASYVSVKELDIEIILKINKGSGEQSQESEEL